MLPKSAIKSGIVYSESESDLDDFIQENQKLIDKQLQNSNLKNNVVSESDSEFESESKSVNPIKSNYVESSDSSSEHENVSGKLSNQLSKIISKFENESDSESEVETRKPGLYILNKMNVVESSESDFEMQNGNGNNFKNLQTQPRINTGAVPESDSESDTGNTNLTLNMKQNPPKQVPKRCQVMSESDSDSDLEDKHPQQSKSSKKIKKSISKNIKINPGVVNFSDESDASSDSDSDSSNSKPIVKNEILERKQSLKLTSFNLQPSKKPSELSENEEILNIFKAIHQNEKNPDLWQSVLKINSEKNVHEKKITFPCCVCLENYYETDEYGKCNPVYNNDETRKIHKICQECLRQTTLPENVNLDPRGAGIRCPSGECPNLMLISDIQKFLEPNIRDQLLERIGNMSIVAAEIPNLYRCEGCAVLIQVETEEPNYVCYNCKRNNCKNCEREYVGNHVGRTCQEFIDYEKNEVIRKKKIKVGAEMNEMIVHKCHKCGLQFIQDGGCNKMTCSCGATQCYICREKNINYGHFGKNKKCQLFANVRQIEEKKLDQHRRQNNIDQI